MYVPFEITGLWTSHDSQGQYKSHPGPRKKYPKMISPNHAAIPMVNMVKANHLSFTQYLPALLGFLSTYGMAISPTMISVGTMTPATHGSKYTSISWSPTKYHGAFAGFGVLVGVAISSRGALTAIEMIISARVISI